MHLLNLPLLPHPRCVLYSQHPVFRLYEYFNIKSIVGSLFFFFALGGRGVWRRMVQPPPPALAPCIPGSYSLLMSSSPYYIFFYLFWIAKYLAMLHNLPPDFSPINPSTRPFLSRLPYFYCTLSSGLSPPRSSSQ